MSYQPGMMVKMSVELSLECLARETTVLEENLPSPPVHHKSDMA
jgi:hypothetical protein